MDWIPLAHVFVFVWYCVQRNEKERCVIGNCNIYHVKSICHCEERKSWGGEIALARQEKNVLFSSNTIGTQSVTLGPVGIVFVSPSNVQGTEAIMTYCWFCLYSVSQIHVLSLPQPSEGRTKKRGDCRVAHHPSM